MRGQKRGSQHIYGGGKVGVMGVLADAALHGGGKVIGVMPRSLVKREIAHTALSEFLIVASMHERKTKMAELADGFIALPGERVRLKKSSNNGPGLNLVSTISHAAF